MRQDAEVPRCPKCGFRRRGPNHDEGQHHKHGAARSTGDIVTKPKEKRRWN